MAKPADQQDPKSYWQRVRKTEIQYALRLRRISEQIGFFVQHFPDAGLDPFQTDKLTALLTRYSDVILPWAEAEGNRVVAEVAQRNERAWYSMAKRMSSALRQEIHNTPLGGFFLDRSKTQATLIQSLPLEAAERIRNITIEAASKGTRAADVSALIQASGQVSKVRANLIARTEVARTASLLTQVRSESIGCTHYIWRTSEDAIVRPAHAKMANVVCEWAKPPQLSDGTTTHPGQIYNCRCYPEPILPGETAEELL